MSTGEVRRSFSAGELIFQEGALGDCAYVIESGEVEISLTRDGEHIRLATRGEGEIFGEMAIIDAEPRSATVTALRDCTLLVLTYDQLQKRLRGLDPVLRMVFGTVLQRFRAQLRDCSSSADAAPPPADKEDRPEQSAETGGYGEAIAQIELQHELERGIEAGQLEFHLQPIVDSDDRRAVGFEALARWRHPERGLVPPGAFIPLAEKTGLAAAISRCAVTSACRDAARLRAECDPALYVSANATPEDICDPAFFEFVSDRLLEFGLTADALCLEITETTLIENAEQILEMLARYRDLGVRVSIDDFGAGYSNFSYLARFPVQTLKIDKSIVDEMDEGERGETLVEMIASMARLLDLKIVAEGVERLDQADRLRDLGCDLLQGYYFSKPKPIADILEWRRERLAAERLSG